ALWAEQRFGPGAVSVTMNAAEALNEEIDGAHVGEHGIEVDVQALLENLASYDDGEGGSGRAVLSVCFEELAVLGGSV
ncbi:hypothetical protein K4H00_26565, partial [Mycobacterium tuberculosis]|nr:hypothetical protein [Mycobacterium tuberculosis]